MRHKLLRISSRDRDEKKSSTSDFTVNLNNVFDLQRVRSIVVKYVTIPCSWYNITSTNNTFSYKIATAVSSFTIAEGQYSITTLIAAMVAAGASRGLGITQSTLTGKLAFTSTTAIEYLDERLNVMAEVLGILYAGGSGADVTSFTAGGVPSLSSVHNVFIESTALGDSNLVRTTGQARNTLAIVPITVTYGFTEQYVSQHTDIDDVDNVSAGGRNIQHIDIKATDHNGAVLDLHGQHVSIILKLYY